MRKIILPACLILVTSVANARTEYYTSVKMGLGDTTIYAQDDIKYGDLLAASFDDAFGSGHQYDNSSSLTWELSPALGLDWSLDNMYVKHNPYGWFHLRLEGEFGYNRYYEDGKIKKGYTVIGKTKLKMDQFFLLANGYADFRINKVVPYVGLGLGYSFGKQELIVNYNGAEVSDSINDNGIIYALHLGVAYKYSEITTWDLGYRRVYAPTEDDGLNIFGTLRLGMRFRI